MKEYKKYFTLGGSPEDIYNCLTNPVMIEIWTGEPAVMPKEPGGEFSMWDGAICGKIISYEPNKQIEQLWYFGEDETSLVTIKLHPHKKGTSVEVKQQSIPEDAYDNIAEGWDEDYFGALEELFEI
ncbi:SRPBCC domain-containing protein [Halosquirtibacter xylanolyticus]|uniref:SRPBCC domain-containing protein n=1 Tax=Halosquirtibacter xylanolyticus TaxID=3374599 RepID=UPI0037492CC8|nr:SRPBCC domain-containing protein [Prolixibacteraceae bacterium]